MLSKPQIIFIKQAQKQAGVDDARWRTLLDNVAGVSSSKDLNNTSFEDVLAVLEDMGFRDRNDSTGTKWRDKVARRGRFANERAVYKIHQLARSSRYCLPSLCERFSNGRVGVPEKLTAKEAWNLIEMLKSESAREAKRNSAGDYQREMIEGSGVSGQGSEFNAAPSGRDSEPAGMPVIRPTATPAAVPCEITEDHDDIPF